MSKDLADLRSKFEQLVRDTCHVDEHTFKLDGGAYFRTTYAKTHDGLPPREMASVQTLWTFYQAGAAYQRAQQPQSAEAVGYVMTEEQMGIGYDRRTGPVTWFGGYPKGGSYLYTTPQPSAGVVMPDELFDGHAVMNALSEKAKARTSAENVSDVLDAVVRLIRARLNGKGVGRG